MLNPLNHAHIPHMMRLMTWWKGWFISQHIFKWSKMTARIIDGGSEATATPHLVLTISSIILKISSIIMSSWDTEWGCDNFHSLTGISGWVNCSRASCCFSIVVNGLQLWTFISSTCQRHICERTDTFAQYAFSSSIISASFWSLACKLSAWSVWLGCCMYSSYIFLNYSAICVLITWTQFIFCSRPFSRSVASKDWSALYLVLISSICSDAMIWAISF